MDIPAPSDKTDDEGIKIAVSTASTAPKEEAKQNTTSDPEIKPAPEKDTSISKDDDDRKKIAELISTKKYYLNIKEKRQSPLLAVNISTKKTKKTKKKSVKKSDSKAPKKVETKQAKTIKLAIVVLLFAGSYLAIDAGIIDIGWKPPFSILGNKQASEVPPLTGDAK